MQLITRRKALQLSGLSVGSALLRPSIAQPNARPNTLSSAIDALPSKPSLFSVDLYMAMSTQAMGLLGQLTSGSPDYDALQKGAGLVRTYAGHLENVGIDDAAREVSRKKIGAPPDKPSSAHVRQAIDHFTAAGVKATPSDVESMLQLTQAQHDNGHSFVARVGASGVYHSVADMLEAGAFQAYQNPPHTVSASSPASASFAPAVYIPAAHARYVLIGDACSVSPIPAPTPWYCPSTAQTEMIGSALSGMGSTVAIVISNIASNLDSLVFCGATVLGALTSDVASDGVAAVATPFEVWLCENSQAITSGLRAALTPAGTQASIGALGAIAGSYLYGKLKDFLRGKGCSV